MDSKEEKSSEKDFVLKFSSKHAFFGVVGLVIAVFFVFAIMFLNPNFLMAPLAIFQNNGGAINSVEPIGVLEGTEKVAATVNGEKIFLSEVEKRFNTLPPELAESVSMEIILQNMIDGKLLLTQAEKNGFTVEQSEIEEVFVSQKAAVDEIITLGEFSEEEVRMSIEESLLVQKFLEEDVFSQTTATESEITAFFEQNKQDIAQVRASHILVETLAEAQDLMEQLNNGADFGALALEHSIDTVSGESNGDLGFFMKGDVVPEFGEAAFALAPGEMSDIVESQFGFHIILVSDTRNDLESFKEPISQLLVQQKNEQVYTDLLADLNSKAEIEILMNQI